MKVISRAALPIALCAVLTACGTDDDFGKEPLICPVVGVLADAGSMRVFADGAGREQGNVAYDLEFMRANLLECELHEGKMTAALRFEARAESGPAAPSNEYNYPYFVALLNPEGEVISKTAQTGTVKFKSGKTESLFAGEYDDIKFTVPEGKDGRGYEILIGFQLTREQVEFNRAKKAAPDPNLVTQ